MNQQHFADHRIQRMAALFHGGGILGRRPSEQTPPRQTRIPVQAVPVDEFLHFRQRIFFVKQGTVAAAFAALFHFAFERRRAVRMMQHVGAAVADIAQTGLTKTDAQLGVLISVSIAEAGVKTANS